MPRLVDFIDDSLRTSLFLMFHILLVRSTRPLATRDSPAITKIPAQNMKYWVIFGFPLRNTVTM